jgi:hypothetical protein
MQRRTLIAAAALPWAAQAQGFTPQNAECIAPAAPGGGFDVTCRLTTRMLSELNLVPSPIRTQNMPGGIGAVAINHINAQRPTDPNVLIAFSTGSWLNMAQRRFGRFAENDVRWIGAVGADYGVIAVKRDPASRGGSAWLHAVLRPGEVLEATGPRNSFPLDEEAQEIVLIAGGIGITPLLPMLRAATQACAAWTLLFCVRHAVEAPFLEEARALGGTKVLGRFIVRRERDPAPSLRQAQGHHTGLRQDEPAQRSHQFGIQLIIGLAAPAARGRKRVEHDRQLRVIGHDLGHGLHVVGRAKRADLDGRHRHILQHSAGLVIDPLVVNHQHVFHAGGVLHRQGGDHAGGVAAHGSTRERIRRGTTSTGRIRHREHKDRRRCMHGHWFDERFA